MKNLKIVMISCVVALLTACAPLSLVVMTHDSFAASEEVIKQFEEANNTKVTILMSGDAGSMLNRAILTKNAPEADVLYGFDNTFLSRALVEDILESYQSPLLSEIPAEFQLDASNRALPVDYGDVCINYDKNYFKQHNLAVPSLLEDLTDPRYAGLLVVENPATSSPGLAFLLATVAEYGQEGYLDFWRRLNANGMLMVNDWNSAYYTHFSGSSGKGAYPMVVSYASSPAAEVIFSEQTLTDSPTGSIIGRNTCFRQIEFAGILKGSRNAELARKFIDFMLEKTFQEDIPGQMFMFPVNPNAVLPDVFAQYAQTSAEPAQLDYAHIAENRETWVTALREVLLP